jgi:hypothetical protein
MGCLFGLMAGLFPRFMLLIFWIARPERVDAVFTSVVWPILGIVFLPLTTLMYVLLWRPGVGVTGGDWFWIGLAALFDLAHWGASSRRDAYSRTPAYR